MRTSIGFSLVVATVCGLSSAADAQELDWAQKMFSELRHDFGTLARGADARHTITITNLYEEPMRIVNVSTTCGCAAAAPDVRSLNSGQQAHIEVVMNTEKFLRRKDSNVDVTLAFTDARGQSVSRTVRVPVSAYIRPDVVIEPGAINFGSVDLGAGAERRAEISYSGRSDWQVRGVELDHEHLTAEVVEQSRQRGRNNNARVTYDLIVRVKPTAPQGPILKQLILLTDDPSSPRVPVIVRARVEPDIIVTPAQVTLGSELVPGRESRHTVVLKGRRPFRIEKIESESDRECFKVRLTREARNIHVLPLTFTAPDEPGPFVEQFTVTIAGRPQPITFTAEGTIVSASTTTARN